VWALEREGAELYHDPAFGLRCSRDLAFDEVVKQLMSAEVYSAGTVTITGGEPTIREDFIDILMWLYYNRPDKAVAIQTNGRRLSDLNLVKSVRRFTR
jgi:molybdenum cofactor biosynthesis enzyme MoaA